MKTVNCLVVVDFAALNQNQYEYVLKTLREKYPDFLILPNQEGMKKDDDTLYCYWVLYIEKQNCTNDLKVLYHNQLKRKYKILIEISGAQISAVR